MATTSDYDQFNRPYCASKMALFDLVCDFTVPLKWRQNWWSKLRPGTWSFVCPREECRFQLARHSSMGSTNHHVRSLSLRHLISSIRGRNAVFWLVIDRRGQRGQLPSRARHSSLWSANHHVRGLNLGHTFCPHFSRVMKNQTKSKTAPFLMHRIACWTGPNRSLPPVGPVPKTRLSKWRPPPPKKKKKSVGTWISWFSLSLLNL